MLPLLCHLGAYGADLRAHYVDKGTRFVTTLNIKPRPLKLLTIATLAIAASITIAAVTRIEPVAAAACGPTAIGLARTQEIKTTGGPRFGHQQYKENDFLADGEVVLTFDDGPSSIYTPRVLAALDAHCTKATFFMVGSRASAEPKLVKDVQRRGHTLGSHTWSHANMRAIGAVRAKDEIELGFSGVQKAAGQPIAPFFRFPYLADSRAMMAHLQARNIANISIDADSYDYKTLNPAEVHRAIISQITQKRKGIILFHDIQPATAGALQALLSDLKARGFRVVHMVPDRAVTSQPTYDVMAGRDANKRLVATAANPLAKRAVTWPMPGIQSSPISSQPLPPVGSGTGVGPGVGQGPGQGANQSQGLGQPYTPPPSVFAGPQPQLLPPVAPAPRPRADDDWRRRVFQN
jgi:peptidoglycan-N-acetylglucosamine deacetylase